MYARLLSGAGIEINGPASCDMQVRDPRVWRRIVLQGSLGLGEAYVDEWWDAQRLDEFFMRIASAEAEQRILNIPKFLKDAAATVGNLQNLKRSGKVAEVHYDLSNELYRAMLGERMVYTCGYWNKAKTLDEAQEHKLALVCDKLHLKSGMRVLDIGCGWGGFAKFAAERYGVSVVGVTVSEEQAVLAQSLCRGLPIDIQVQDYRKTEGKFDRIVSLGMFEHVGRKNYALYMRLVRDLLTEDGLFVIQTIGRQGRGSGIDPWVTKYIFPNSEIPTLRRLVEAIDGKFRIEDWHNFGADYDRTLMAWYENFKSAWPDFSKEFGSQFYRLWSYYLLMFAGVFRARSLNLWQVVLSPNSRKKAYRRPLL